MGALNVWLDEYELLILLHLALGTLLWSARSSITLQLSPARAALARPRRGGDRMIQAAAARTQPAGASSSPTTSR